MCTCHSVARHVSRTAQRVRPAQRRPRRNVALATTPPASGLVRRTPLRRARARAADRAAVRPRALRDLRVAPAPDLVWASSLRLARRPPRPAPARRCSALRSGRDGRLAHSSAQLPSAGAAWHLLPAISPPAGSQPALLVAMLASTHAAMWPCCASSRPLGPPPSGGCSVQYWDQASACRTAGHSASSPNQVGLPARTGNARSAPCGDPTAAQRWPFNGGVRLRLTPCSSMLSRATSHEQLHKQQAAAPRGTSEQPVAPSHSEMRGRRPRGARMQPQRRRRPVRRVAQLRRETRTRSDP